MKGVIILTLLTVIWAKPTYITDMNLNASGCDETLPVIRMPIAYTLEYAPFCSGICHPTIVKYRCPRDYVLTGLAALKCVSGKWSPNVAPTCRKKPRKQSYEIIPEAMEKSVKKNYSLL